MSPEDGRLSGHVEHQAGEVQLALSLQGVFHSQPLLLTTLCKGRGHLILICNLLDQSIYSGSVGFKESIKLKEELIKLSITGTV